MLSLSTGAGQPQTSNVLPALRFKARFEPPASANKHLIPGPSQTWQWPIDALVDGRAPQAQSSMSMDTHAVCFSKQMTREVRRGARRPEVVPACLRCESAIPLELHPPLRVSAARKFHHFLAAPFPALERRLSGVRGRLARVAAHPRGALPQRTGAARASASWARPSCASSTGRTCHAIAWIGRGCRPKRTAFCAPPIWPAPPLPPLARRGLPQTRA